jgi:hypothetical protein
MPKPRYAMPDLAALDFQILDPALFPPSPEPKAEAVQKPMGFGKRNGPRARPHRSMFYVDRAREAWTKLEEVLAAPLPENVEIDRAAVERVSGDLAALKGQIADWVIDTYRQHPPRSHPAPHMRAVLAAIYREREQRQR